MVETIRFLMRDFEKQFKQKNISIISAGTAFFFFLSIVPMVLLFFTIIPYTPLSKEMLIEDIQNDVPAWALPLVTSIIHDVFEKSLGLLSFAAVIALFSSSQGVFAMYRGLNALHEVEERRNYVVVRLRAAVFMVIMLFGVLLSLITIMVSRRLIWFLEGKIPMITNVVTFFMYFRFWIMIFFLGIVFAAIYTLLPAAKGLKFTKQIPGAFFVSGLWGVFSWAFSVYTSVMDLSLYGSLSVVVLTLLWLYFCMVLFFFGAFLNIYIDRVHNRKFN